MDSTALLLYTMRCVTFTSRISLLRAVIICFSLAAALGTVPRPIYRDVGSVALFRTTITILRQRLRDGDDIHHRCSCPTPAYLFGRALRHRARCLRVLFSCGSGLVLPPACTLPSSLYNVHTPDRLWSIYCRYFGGRDIPLTGVICQM